MFGFIKKLSYNEREEERRGCHLGGKRTKRNDLGRYAGEWLVMSENQIVAHDKSLAQAMRQASRKHLKHKPSVFLVPRRDEGPYLLLFL